MVTKQLGNYAESYSLQDYSAAEFDNTIWKPIFSNQHSGRLPGDILLWTLCNFKRQNGEILHSSEQGSPHFELFGDIYLLPHSAYRRAP